MAVTQRQIAVQLVERANQTHRVSVGLSTILKALRKRGADGGGAYVESVCRCAVAARDAGLDDSWQAAELRLRHREGDEGQVLQFLAAVARVSALASSHDVRGINAVGFVEWNGADEAPKRMDAICRIIDEAHKLGRPCTFRGASQRLRYAGAAELAIEIMREITYPHLANAEGLALWKEAQAYGLGYTQGGLARLFRRRGAEDARRWVHALGRIRAMDRELGFDSNLQVLIGALGRARGDADLVIEHMRRRHAVRASRATGRCTAGIPSGTRWERENARARCGCPTCTDILVREMLGLADWMLSRLRMTNIVDDYDDQRQELRLAILKAIERYRVAPPNASAISLSTYLRTEVRAHFSRIDRSQNAKSRRPAQEPISFDNTPVQGDGSLAPSPVLAYYT